MRITLEIASAKEAAAVADIRNSAADRLTKEFGSGHWSAQITEKTVLLAMKHGTVFIAGGKRNPVATLTLSRKKPWAHDRTYFTACKHPLFLQGMAVAPNEQRTGIGTACIRAAIKSAKDFPCDAICLDAYDHAAGAGEFYRKCGFKEVGRVEYRGTPLVYFEMLL
jgi:GNAT superfamily N-acetyltransferase